MFDELKHTWKIRKLMRERKKTEEFYKKAYDGAKTYEKQQEVLSSRFAEVGLLDDEIASEISRHVQDEAELLYIPSPPFSESDGKWVKGDYNGRWRLSIEQVHELRAAVRKERKERIDSWQPRFSLLIGLGGMLIALVSVLKK